MVLSNIDVFVWSWPAQHSNIDSTNSMSLGAGLSVWSANGQLRVVMHKLHTSPLHLLLFYIWKSQICIQFWLSCRLLDLFKSGTDLFFVILQPASWRSSVLKRVNLNIWRFMIVWLYHMSEALLLVKTKTSAGVLTLFLSLGRRLPCKQEWDARKVYTCWCTNRPYRIPLFRLSNCLMQSVVL